MQVTKRFNSHLDQALGSIPRRDVVTICNRFATHRFNFIDDLLCWRLVATLAVNAGADIVHDDQSSVFGQTQSVFTPDSAT
jgi:hypothetical protein